MTDYNSKPIINLSEDFTHLSKAPIVEAVIDIRITPKNILDEHAAFPFFKERLSDYSKQENMNAKSLQIEVGKERNAPVVKDLGFVGTKVSSTSEPYIAQFYKEAFIFSRLSPYNEWKIFMAEAIRLWGLYCELVEPEEILRIGVRFINKIDVIESQIELSNYYENAPDSIKNTVWPILNYMHKDTYQPTPIYIVNIIKTVKHISDKSIAGLILDIDVIMNKKFGNDLKKITDHLIYMKWLKNKAFFNSIKPNIIERYK
ncbi:MAG: TIGR04255 family protein [Candidatus Omnitrophota bacterium]